MKSDAKARAARLNGLKGGKRKAEPIPKPAASIKDRKPFNPYTSEKPDASPQPKINISAYLR